jgi:hypothetical protein
MPEQKEGSRVRMNFGQNAKGLVPMDLTVEFPTVEETEAEAVKGIAAYKRVLAAAGLKAIDSAA